MTVHLTKRRGTPAIDRSKLIRRAQRLLKALEHPSSELSLLLTGDEEMTTLNRTWRSKDKTTDVLSFCQREGGSAVLRPDVLGDVVISLAQAQRQARRRKASLWDEVLVLLVHGVLHLLGRDHEGTDQGRADEMLREQKQLVSLLRRDQP